MEGQERRLTDYHTVITTWGEGGSIKIPFIYTDIQGVTGGPGDPTPPSLASGRGKRRPSLPLGDLVGVEGAVLGGVLGR